MWVDGVRVRLGLWPGLPMWERDWLVAALRQHGHAHRVFDREGALWRALWQARHAPAMRWLIWRVVASGVVLLLLGHRWWP